MKKYLYFGGLLVLMIFTVFDCALAEAAGGAAGGASGLTGIGVALGAALAIGIPALAGAFSQGKTVSTALDAIGRNPSASGKLFVPMILGLVFMETLVIFSFVIAINLAGKL